MGWRPGDRRRLTQGEIVPESGHALQREGDAGCGKSRCGLRVRLAGFGSTMDSGAPCLGAHETASPHPCGWAWR